MNARGADETTSLYERFAPRLKAYFARGGFDRVEAEDAVQELFLRLLEELVARCRVVLDPEAWLFGTARHMVIDEHHRRAVVRLCTALEDVAGDADLRAERADDCRALRGAMRRLPRHLRATLHLHYWRNWSYRRIAARAGISVGAVGARLNRARALLGAMLRAPAAK